MLVQSCRAALLLIVAALTGCADEPVRPNLLLVSVDTLRPDRLACYGGEADVGRNLCRLAKDGVRYTWAFSTAPATAPAVASLLTSRYPSQHRVSERAVSFLDGTALTLGEVLTDAGYATAAFVSNPVLGRGRNLHQGFEIYDASMTRQEANRPGFAERDAETVTDAALAWARVARQPFLLWVHYQDPHGPYDPPGSAPPAPDAPDALLLPVLADHSGRGGIPAYQRLSGVTSVERYEQRYLDEIRYLDTHLGRLVDTLDAQDRPLGVLVTADHGEAFGEDGYYFAHGHSLGLDQIRVPLLWRPPAGTTPSVISTPVSVIDAAPTLLAAAGLEIPLAFEGRPLPEPGAAATPRVLFAEHPLRAAALAGTLYYARDRRPLDAPVRDPVSGGRLHGLPARFAQFSPDGETPSYTPAEGQTGAAALEDSLAAFLSDGASGGSSESPTRRVSPETRERLRALGYLE